ncbi:MAG: hypothetical protein AAF991_00830, partial [Pseudomonadota bacterium]
QLFATALQSRVWPDGSRLTQAQSDVCAEVLALRWKLSSGSAKTHLNLDGYGSRHESCDSRYPQSPLGHGVSIH